MTFLEAYALHGPDTIAIAEALSITEAEADALINERMDRKARSKERWERTKANLAEIRAKYK